MTLNAENVTGAVTGIWENRVFMKASLNCLFRIRRLRREPSSPWYKWHSCLHSLAVRGGAFKTTQSWPEFACTEVNGSSAIDLSDSRAGLVLSNFQSPSLICSLSPSSRRHVHLALREHYSCCKIQHFKVRKCQTGTIWILHPCLFAWWYTLQLHDPMLFFPLHGQPPAFPLQNPLHKSTPLLLSFQIQMLSSYYWNQAAPSSVMPGPWGTEATGERDSLPSFMHAMAQCNK